MLPIISHQLYGLDLHAALFIPLNILSLGIGLIIVYNIILFKSVVDTRKSLQTYESYPDNISYISDTEGWIESRNALYSKHTLMRSVDKRIDDSMPAIYEIAMAQTWRHQRETFSALQANSAGNSPVTGEFLALWTVTRSFDVFFDPHLNKSLSK